MTSLKDTEINIIDIGDKKTAVFAEEVRNKLLSDQVSTTVLETDQKVLARITDGIYRHVSSAIRELVCNSYDADATQVFIETDVPRFKKITVRDNGNGMSIDTLSNMLHHIGGSAKRNKSKSQLGIFDENDSTISPIFKRKIIGKIGIGLFSVAQLTRDFSIITKQKDTDYYLIADINLHNYSEEQSQQAAERGAGFEAGSVTVYSRKAEDITAHGTDIVLRNIKKSAIDQLMSVDIWNQALDSDTEFVGNDAKPDYHIGGVKDDGEIVSEDASLPWGANQPPEEKFKSFYEKFVALENLNKFPSLQRNIDNYLNILWTLGLSLPVKYIDKDPYDITLDDSSNVFCIQNSDTSASKIETDNKKAKISEILQLKAHDGESNFQVFVDGVEILRPIKPIEPVRTSADFKGPILFYGKFSPDLSNLDNGVSGGKLSFEAFIKWSPRIVPKEHRGVTVRIHGATGVLFDPEFMRWQLAEYSLKNQLLVEINIVEGFESALNIDRESFNIAHPHYQLVMRWLHKSLKQAVYTIKKIKSENRQEAAEDRKQNRTNKLLDIVSGIKTPKHDENENPTKVILVENPTETPKESGTLAITNKEFKDSLSSSLSKENENKVHNKLSAIISILDKFKLLDELSSKEKNSLILAITQVLSFEE